MLLNVLSVAPILWLPLAVVVIWPVTSKLLACNCPEVVVKYTPVSPIVLTAVDVDVGVVEITETNAEGKRVQKGLEIDFIATKGNNKYYIQSAFDMPDLAKEQQEKKSLIKTKDSFKKIIVVKDDIKLKRDDNGITTMGIFDFLLNENSLDM